jgi:hypothetical protein
MMPGRLVVGIAGIRFHGGEGDHDALVVSSQARKAALSLLYASRLDLIQLSS